MIQPVALPLGSLEVSWVKDEKALDENSRRMVNETQPCGPVKGKRVDPHVFQEEFSDHYTNTKTMTKTVYWCQMYFKV